MKDPNREQFEQRLAGLIDKSAPNKSIQKVMKDDGLIVEVARPARRRVSFRYRSIIIAVLLFVCMKASIFAQLGKEEYLQRVKNLQAGTSLEVTAAFLLDVDPVTEILGGAFHGVIN